MDAVIELWTALPVVIQIMIKIVTIMLPLMILVAYYTYAERKIIEYTWISCGILWLALPGRANLYYVAPTFSSA